MDVKISQTEPVVIQVDSPDTICQWNVHSDTLYLSKGTRMQLGLGDKVFMSMQEFASHIPEESRSNMFDLLSGLLSGASQPIKEIIHPFDNLLVHAHLVVIEREKDGHARTVVGYLRISMSYAYRSSVTSPTASQVLGYWRFTPGDGIMRLDGQCAAMLGHVDFKPIDIPLPVFRNNVHPEDGIALFKRFELLFEHGQWGDTLDDVFRYRMENGQYGRYAVNGSVLSREPDGSVKEIIGSLQSLGTVEPTSRRDAGNLLYAIASSGDGLWDWNVETDEVTYSPRFLAMLGYTHDTIPTAMDGWRDLIHPSDINKFIPARDAIVSSPKYGDTFECSYRMLKSDGYYAWLLCRGYVTQRAENGRAMRLVGLHTDISNTQDDFARIEEQVRNDPLTGLRSRTFFNMEVDRIEKSGLRPVSTITCDLDGLKLVNDYLGHDAGDAMLKHMAIVLRRVLRATDCVARMGGDEFTILLPSCTEENTIVLLAQIRAEMRRHNTTCKEAPLVASFGVACALTSQDTLANALILADRRMLKAKHEHRAESHETIKKYIEEAKDIIVCLDDSRYL